MKIENKKDPSSLANSKCFSELLVEDCHRKGFFMVENRNIKFVKTTILDTPLEGISQMHNQAMYFVQETRRLAI